MERKKHRERKNYDVLRAGKKRWLAMTISRSFFTLLCIFLFGCGGGDKVVVSNGSKLSDSQQNLINNIDKNSYAGLEDVFRDTSSIVGNNKPMFIVFGKNGCVYCEKLKDDIKSDAEIRGYLKEAFSSYYVNISYSKEHYVEFMGKSVGTATLAYKYNLGGTPLIVITSSKGKTILRFPGYIPINTLRAALRFANDGSNWRGIDNQEDIMSAFLKYSNSSSN